MIVVAILSLNAADEAHGRSGQWLEEASHRIDHPLSRYLSPHGIHGPLSSLIYIGVDLKRLVHHP